MDAVFKKLNYKVQKDIVVLNAPGSFEQNIRSLPMVQVHRQLEDVPELSFFMCFVQKQEEIDRIVPHLVLKLKGDAVLWFCYPKGTSKKYKCDFNRDTGWTLMGKYALEPVRMVAIDDDWSALRFRKVEFIKNITRSEGFALSKEAKERTTNRGE